MARVLFVEDDSALARGVTSLLRSEGYAVDHAEDAEGALEIIGDEPYSVIVLDVGLPGLSGFEALRILRQRGCRTPVMLLTARDAMEDKVQGLDLGADDYILKPFDPPELLARVRAQLRRGSGGEPSPLITIGNLVCNTSAHTASVGPRLLDLRRREWAVLHTLAQRAGNVVPKERLVSEVFGYDEPVGTNAVEVYVTRLRKKLAPDGPAIRTLRGLGYMMERD